MTNLQRTAEEIAAEPRSYELRAAYLDDAIHDQMAMKIAGIAREIGPDRRDGWILHHAEAE